MYAVTLDPLDADFSFLAYTVSSAAALSYPTIFAIVFRIEYFHTHTSVWRKIVILRSIED